MAEIFGGPIMGGGGNGNGNYVNPNVLDNWYFATPVNQRAQTTYNAMGYGIDRWINVASAATVTLVEGGITIANAGTSQSGLTQFFEGRNIAADQTYTASLLTADNEIVTVTTPFNVTKTTITTWGGLGIYAPNNGTAPYVTIYVDAGQTTPVIRAAKLELGERQTLAHKDASGNWVLNEVPNYNEQLSRCQRYLAAYNNYDIFLRMYDGTDAIIHLPRPLRAKPAIVNAGNLINITNPSIAWYNLGSNQARLRSSATLSADPEARGLVLLSAEI